MKKFSLENLLMIVAAFIFGAAVTTGVYKFVPGVWEFVWKGWM